MLVTIGEYPPYDMWRIRKQGVPVLQQLYRHFTTAMPNTQFGIEHQPFLAHLRLQDMVVLSALRPAILVQPVEKYRYVHAVQFDEHFIAALVGNASLLAAQSDLIAYQAGNYRLEFLSIND